MSKSNRHAKKNVDFHVELLNPLSRVERHLAILAEPTRRTLLQMQTAEAEAQRAMSTAEPPADAPTEDAPATEEE